MNVPALMFPALSLLLLSPTLGRADVLGLNDYDAIYEENQSSIVMDADGIERLDLPGGVVLTWQDGDLTQARDRSGDGALGCYVLIMVEFQSYLANCEVSSTPAEIAQFDRYMDGVLAFYARNASPPSDLNNARMKYGGLVARRTHCTADASMQPMFDGISKAFMSTPVAEFNEVDRLPVNNPCL